MEHEEWAGYAAGARDSRESLRAVLLLAALLVCVFFLAMGAYGYFEAVGDGALSGELPDAVLALRGFVEENEAVSVLLGLSPEGAVEVMGEADEHIREAADAYIKEKQG